VFGREIWGNFVSALSWDINSQAQSAGSK